MLRTGLLTLLTLVIAIGGGGVSVWYALSVQEGVGAVTIGGWTAYPEMGTPDADPYSKARVARDGLLVLGRAEGLAFVAQHDSTGETLRRECRYMVEGTIPPARLWTLYAIDARRVAIAAASHMPGVVNSYGVLFLPDNSLAITVGNLPAPGNWLATGGSGPMALVLTLYDTPIAGSTGMADIELPQVLKVGCDV